jgi:PTH1 family peptidyl-tRNA hydrolase
MKLIVALGNPGLRYSETRHNAGVIVLDEIAAEFRFPTTELNLKFRALMTDKVIEGEKIIIAKPQDYMNKSGEVVKKIMDYFEIPLENLIVLHDDLDIELGKFKVAENSSAAGHNGVQDIIDKLGTQKFKRIRIGIEGEEKRKERVMPGDAFVLQDFSSEEIKIVKNLAGEISKLII